MVHLMWKEPNFLPTDSYYCIRYKEIVTAAKWQQYMEDFQSNSAQLTGLKSNTKYVFQVKVMHDDQEGQYSEMSEEITTFASVASQLLSESKEIKNGSPSVYAVTTCMTEVLDARNKPMRTRKFNAGSAPPRFESQHKTIMLVGETGTGKSTFVDGLVNYVLGVKFVDPYRYTVERHEVEEIARQNQQALSQTDWVTCYTLHQNNGGSLDFTLTIIDTPGFGDTRGIHRDESIVQQIRHLFSAKGNEGVLFIDAICFLVKASDVRLTSTQKYIFDAVLSLFGQDIKDNIMTIITFADGQDNPPVLASLHASGIPFGKHFDFNNICLFAENTDSVANAMCKQFWDVGTKAYKSFFKTLGKMQTQNLNMTNDVLVERHRLELTIQSILPQVDEGLMKIGSLRDEEVLLKHCYSEICENEDFDYEVNESKHVKKPLPVGQHTTNCLNCNVTCHSNCKFADDDDKIHCNAMDTKGYCTKCNLKCIWSDHKNTPYLFEFVVSRVKKTYSEKRKKYQEAEGRLLSVTQVIHQLSAELSDLQNNVESLIKIANKSSNRLKEIALRPNPMSLTEYIDVMIEAETSSKRDGFLNRVAVLLEYKKKAEFAKSVDRFRNEIASAMKIIDF